MIRTFLLLQILSVAQLSGAQAPALANDAAKKGLQDFRELAGTSPSGQFGLQSAEISEAELQKPLPVYLVKADRLAEYSSNEDPGDLLTDLHSFLYPISVAGKVKSSMQVDATHGKWQMVAVGRPVFIKEVVASIDRAGPGAAIEGLKLVQIPALNMYFVGWMKGKDLTLAPIVDNEDLNLKAGEPLPGAQVFVRLREKAKRTLQSDVPR